MSISVVIPTRNEEDNIATCIDAFHGLGVEIIVVDNSSPDRTREIAAAHGARVFVQGPERCAQRNRGWREATGDYILFVDADMIVPPETLREIVAWCAADEQRNRALYVREVRVGRGLRLKARNFERSFYDATCIDGLRVISREALAQVGGYDENLVACEDWDLDRRLLAAGIRTTLTRGHLLHNEARQNLSKFLKKKAYYSASVDAYRRKWNNDAICQRQFGLFYRYFGVFTEHGKWLKIVRHPILFAIVMAERVAVGFTYLMHR